MRGRQNRIGPGSEGMRLSLWICGRCSTVIPSVETPKECYADLGGCKRSANDAMFLGPFPEGAKAALEIDALYGDLRLVEGSAYLLEHSGLEGGRGVLL